MAVNYRVGNPDAVDAAAPGLPIPAELLQVSGQTAVPIVGQSLVATGPTTFEWGKNDSIWMPRVQPNGATTADVALGTDNSTTVLAVSLATAGLAVSTVYQATVRVIGVLYEDASPEIAGSVDLTCDMTVAVDPAGNIFCGFAATQAPDLSRLVGTALNGATIALVASTGGFTVKVTRPAGIACHARCSWTTNYFEAVGVASDIPQAGTWTTGGFWDADHGIAGTPAAVTGWTSREGTSVVATSGGTVMSETDALTATTVLRGDGSAVMSEINARWAAFGGTHTPLIVCAQITVPSSAAGRIVNVWNASISHRAVDIVFATNTLLVGYRVKDAASTVIGNAVTADVRVTLVYVLHTDGKVYLITSVGTPAAVADTAVGALIVDRMQISSNAKFRRFGVKIPSTANPLLEAQQLYTRLATMV